MKYLQSYSELINEQDKWLNTEKAIKGSYWDNKYNKRQRNQGRIRIDDTVKYQILKRIYKAGHEGMRYTDITKFIVENIKGRKYDWKKDRGYWGTNLLGGPGWRGDKSETDTGILLVYCDKNENGRWILTDRKLIDHFNDLKAEGMLDRSWTEIQAKHQGWDDSDIELFNDLGMLDNMMKNKEE